jgi:hypothetical protein
MLCSRDREFILIGQTVAVAVVVAVAVAALLLPLLLGQVAYLDLWWPLEDL